MLQDSGSIASTHSTKGQDVWKRAGRYFWGPDPINCLSHSYFITPKNHTILRTCFAVYHVTILGWTLFALPKPYDIFAYLTLWGFSICAFYFSLVNFVKLSHHTKKRWKVTYILGEVGATLEFLICPFFFAFLFPAFLKDSPPADQIVLQVCLHLFCPIFIWIEIIMNAMCFPRRHLWFLAFIIIIYPINNFVWTKYIFKHPVYPVMTWDDYKTFIYIIIAIIMGVGGFFVGRYQYRKKRSRPFLGSRASGNSDNVTRLI